MIATLCSGLSCREAAERFDVSASSAIRWAERNCETGSPAALPMGGNRPLLLETERPWVMARMAAQPDNSLQALLAELHERGVHVSYYAVWHIVHRSGLTSKKALHASEQNRPGMTRKCVLWRRYQQRVDPRRLIFVDDTWAKTNMTPIRGWCVRGKRLVAKVPHGHWRTLTIIGALLRDGICAPYVLDGPINAASFLA